MLWLINFPLRYAPVILAATVVAARRDPWWSFFVLAVVAIATFPFVSPDRLNQSRAPYFSDVVIESPWVALAVAIGSQLGRLWP
jgi:hypothetical protein